MAEERHFAECIPAGQTLHLQTATVDLVSLQVVRDAISAALRTLETDANTATVNIGPGSKTLFSGALRGVLDAGFEPMLLDSGTIGGARGSQHTRGEAADIYVPGMSVAVLVDKIQSLHLPFDQLIDEFGRWVHVSHTEQPRRKVLKARIENGKTVYHDIT